MPTDDELLSTIRRRAAHLRRRRTTAHGLVAAAVAVTLVATTANLAAPSHDTTRVGSLGSPPAGSALPTTVPGGRPTTTTSTRPSTTTTTRRPAGDPPPTYPGPNNLSPVNVVPTVGGAPAIGWHVTLTQAHVALPSTVGTDGVAHLAGRPGRAVLTIRAACRSASGVETWGDPQTRQIDVTAGTNSIAWPVQNNCPTS